ncbi:MAG: histidine phosphatase family protein [Candidatus Dormibacteria bacterium]
MPTLILARHGQTVYNASGRIQGQIDPDLSELGREQSRRLGLRLRRRAFARVICSDLRRARDTAAAACPGMEAAFDVDADLREVGLGEWEGRTGGEIAASHPVLWQRWTESASWDLVPGGEGNAAFVARVRRGVARALEGATDEAEILVVTHIGVIRLILGLALCLDLDRQRWPYSIDNTSLTVIWLPPGAVSVDAPGGQVLAVNDQLHLRGIA